jgi:hypothetical protein
MPPPIRTKDKDYYFHSYDYAGSGGAGKGPWGLSDAQPDRHDWEFYSMVQDLKGLADFGRGTVPNIELTDVGAVIAGGLGTTHTKQLSFGSNEATAPTVVITGGIHAREWVAAEFVYLLAEYLVMHYKTAPQNRYEQAIKNLLDTRRIRIIPMLNPAAIYYTVFSADKDARYWRKNRRPLPGSAADWVEQLTAAAQQGRVPNPPFDNVLAQPQPSTQAQYDVPEYDGPAQIPPNTAKHLTWTLENGRTGVDPNRNSDTIAWGYECVPTRQFPNCSPTSDAYFGPNRSSEQETKNAELAIQLAGGAGIAAMIDYHCFAQVILIPSEADYGKLVTSDYRALGDVMQALIKPADQHATPYEFGPVRQVIGYDATGSLADRAAQKYQARALAIELDPAKGSGLAGFDLSREKIRGVFEKNIRGALAALAAPARVGDATTQEAAVRQALQYNAWDVYDRGNQLPKVI